MNAGMDDKHDFGAADRRLLAATAIGPLAALTNLCLSDALAPAACEHGSKLILHSSALAFFLIALAGVLLARRGLRERNHTPPGRPHWMAVVAVWLSIGSALVIAAMEIPNLLLRSCD
jgi:hypothetical protein